VRRLRLGMVGGGDGAFIGGVHRMAARLDGRWDLLAGAFRSDPAASVAFGLSLGLDPDRSYADYRVMADKEAARPDGVDAVSIVTPNASHYAIAGAFLERGIPVICDKPMTVSLSEAEDLRRLAGAQGLPFILTHNYSGYAMIREARALVAAGRIGAVRVVQAEYAQDWLARDLPGHKQAAWRSDPSRAGPGGALGDIATHAFQLAEFVTGLEVEAVAAEVSVFVPGRRLDDNVNMLLRFREGARGALWASQVASGSANGLRLRVFGEDGGLEWTQETPETLLFAQLGAPAQLIRRGGPDLSEAAGRATRLPAGHPEGYLEGFAQIYSDAAEQVSAWREGRRPHPLSLLAPGVRDGVRGLAFIEAALASGCSDGAWTRLADTGGKSDA